MPGYPRPITTVVTAASSTLLTDLAAVKGELNLTTTDSARDAVLTRYITAASIAIAQFCNRTLVKETVKDTFFLSRDNAPGAVRGGADPLQLSRYPIVGTPTVTENGTALTLDVDFIVDAENGQLIRLDGNLQPRRWYTWPLVVQYAGGFETIPADVADAAIRTVSQRYFARGRDPMLRGEKVPGVWEASYWVSTGADAGADNNLSPDVQSMLDNYRTPVVA